MTGGDLEGLLAQMESWLEQPEGLPEAEVLAAWNRDLKSLAAGSHRPEGWEALVARGHQLAVRVQARAAELAVERDRLREELGAQVRGNRALKGYGAASR